MKLRSLGKVSCIVACILGPLSPVTAASNQLLVVGHRGAAGLLPENTLAAFKGAMDFGVDAIELDVHLTSDNQAIVYHDFRLNPAITRDSKGKWIKRELLIKELTLSELKSYDVGKLNRWTDYAKRYPDQKPLEGQQIPTLREVMQLVKSNSETTQLLIELKYSPLKPEEAKSREEITRVVAEMVKAEDIAGRVIIISFDWKILMEFQKIMPQVPAGYVTIAASNFDTLHLNKPGPSPWTAGVDINKFPSIPEAVKSAGGAYWIPNFNHALGDSSKITSEAVRKAQDKGLKVFAWTPDAKSDMQNLLPIGLDGIITNRPDILLSLLER
jgi:glycerophosphoryl diester phosphodiesterase